jgi:hypothetical protein
VTKLSGPVLNDNCTWEIVPDYEVAVVDGHPADEAMLCDHCQHRRDEMWNGGTMKVRIYQCRVAKIGFDNDASANPVCLDCLVQAANALGAA